MSKNKISIIAQCYNEEITIPIYYMAMKEVMDKMNEVNFEIIFIDDNSKDKTLEVIKDLAKKDKRIRYLSMSRNFGRESCAMAGFNASTGDFVSTMDVDLQDPPELLIKMYELIKDNKYDIIATKALARRGYSAFHKFCTNTFFRLTNKISTVKMVDGQREYRLMNRKAIDAILEHKEYLLFNKGLLNDIGFKIKWIEYESQERVAGTTKFPYKKMIKYAITGIIDYSTFPLTMIPFIGIILMIISFMLLFSMIIMSIISCDYNQNLFILITIMTFLTSIIVLVMGVISIYLSHIHIEVKKRPRYIIRETEGELNEK